MRLTILQAPGKRLVKRFDASGRKHGYDKAAEFRVLQASVASFDDFATALSRLEQRQDAAIIRGQPGPWCSLEQPVYRLLHAQPACADRRGRRVLPAAAKGRDDLGNVTYLPMFVEEPTWWVLLDFEGIESEPDWRRRLAETAAWLKLRLPDAFADASCWFQATGGAADPSKPDLGGAWVRMRLGFVLSRGLTQDQLEAWLGNIPGLDPVTFRIVQPIYVGRPIFARGLADPIPVRSGVLEGLEDVVQVPDSLPEARRSSRKRSYVPPADELAGSSDGLLECPELDEALSEVSDEAGSCRAGLGRAAWAYIRAVGGSQVDVAALTARLTEEGLRHRSAPEVATYGLLALVRWWHARAPAEDDDELPTLPDFEPARADRDAALAELRREIAQEIAEAAERIAPRREMKRRQKEAREVAAAPFGDPKLLDADGKRKLKTAMAKASRKAKVEYLAELGLKRLPGREAVLHTGAQGSGKSQAVAKALAGLKGGNVLVLVPTLKKADEAVAEIERQIEIRRRAGQPVSMFAKAYRGRLAPPPEGAQHPAQGFLGKHGINLNRAPAERMCGRPKGLIDDAQRAGCRIRATFCGTCPMRLDCAYLDQLDTIKRYDGRLILVAAHDLMFAPRAFTPDLVVVDEAVVGKAARAIEIAPERLLDPEKWGDAAYATDLVGEKTPLIEIAEGVAKALAQRGRELAALRDAGIDNAPLAACWRHLNAQHETMVEEIAEAGKAGTEDSRLSDMIDRLKGAELRHLALLFQNLRTELGTRRDGTNGTRLVRGRRKLVRQADGSEAEERLDRYVVSSPRGHGLGSSVELIMLDGTGNLMLNAHLFGADVVEKRCSVNRRGAVIQITSTTNSKYQLLARPEADRNRRKVRQLIADLSTVLSGSLLVGSSMKIETKLADEDALDGVQTMHFGAERGMNSAEHCKGVLVIGREQPQLYQLEDLARGFTIAADEPFVSVLDENEEGELRLYRRRRRMRDGSEVWAEVRSHPDPFACALLEQMREAAVAQMADRVRGVWHERVTIIATSVPVDLDVTQPVTQSELMRAAGLAAAGKRGVDAQGWWLQPVEASQRGGGIGVETADSVIDTLIQKTLSLPQFPALLPSAGGSVPLGATLWTHFPQAEAFRLAAALHPGLRAAPPPEGVLRECLHRHGLLPAWADLPAAVPELVPDAIAMVAVKNAEKGQLAEIRQGLQTASYRIAGRRGLPGTVAWNPARIVDPQAALARLLGAGVTVDWQPVAAVPIVEDRPASEAAATEPDRQAETAAGHEPEAAATEPEPVKPEPRRLAFPYGPPKPCRGPSSKTRRHTASKANACVHCGEHCSPGDLTNIQRPGGGWSHLTCELKAPAAPSPELDIMNPETWTPPPGVIEDDGAPPLFGFRGGSDPPSVYVVTDLFRGGDRVMAIVSRHPDPPLVREIAA